MRLLILGGTSFLGPALVEAARERGHELTLFNRGKTRPDLFPEVEKLQGDRDPRKGRGLESLSGKAWDVVIDDSGYFPRVVSASASLLAPAVGHYVFVSTVSVYARNDEPGADEDAAFGTLPDPSVEDMGAGFENYGPLKALCERAVLEAMPGRAALVRPGFIVGPGDPTDRFTYWPVRMEASGEALVPGDPGDPVQVIDVRDLAAWLVRLAETRTTGAFNAVGPESPLAWGRLVEACHSAAGKRAVLRWAPWGLLDEVERGTFPIAVPPSGEARGFHARSNARAMGSGLRFRALEETVASTLAWFRASSGRRFPDLRAGPSPDREREILRALSNRRGP